MNSESVEFITPTKRGTMDTIDPTNHGSRPTSEAKINANRENAKRSTGPRTEAGKARSRLNAVQHGITAQIIVLPGEDADKLQALYDQIRGDLEPVGEFEQQLVERITASFWRLKRCERVEDELYAYRLLQDIEDDGLAETKPPTTTLPRFEGVPYNSQDDRTEGLLAALLARETGQEEGVSMGRAFLHDVITGNSLGHLGRYETTHLRNLQRYWETLEQKQTKRLQSLPKEK
jgi:hypothetical protein